MVGVVVGKLTPHRELSHRKQLILRSLPDKYLLHQRTVLVLPTIASYSALRASGRIAQGHAKVRNASEKSLVCRCSFSNKNDRRVSDVARGWVYGTLLLCHIRGPLMTSAKHHCISGILAPAVRTGVKRWRRYRWHMAWTAPPGPWPSGSRERPGARLVFTRRRKYQLRNVSNMLIAFCGRRQRG
jgi:hypothetical protein